MDESWQSKSCPIPSLFPTTPKKTNQIPCMLVGADKTHKKITNPNSFFAVLGESQVRQLISDKVSVGFRVAKQWDIIQIKWSPTKTVSKFLEVDFITPAGPIQLMVEQLHLFVGALVGIKILRTAIIAGGFLLRLLTLRWGRIGSFHRWIGNHRERNYARKPYFSYVYIIADWAT